MRVKVLRVRVLRVRGLACDPTAIGHAAIDVALF